MNLINYKYKDLLSMSKADFDKALAEDNSNVGFLASLENLMKLSYGQLQAVLVGLDKDGCKEEEKKKLYEQTAALMMSIEYKICCIVEKKNRLITSEE